MKTKLLIIMAVLFVGTAAFAAPTIEEILGEYAFTEVSSDWDQLWRDLNGGLTFKAEYAGYTHQLGIVYYTQDNYQNEIWFDGANNDGIWGDGDSDAFDLDNGKSFVFALKVNDTGNIWYSDPTMNSDGMDHMRTFDTGLVDASGHAIYAIAFEDKGPVEASDWDFNDNVTLVMGAAPVPAPSAILLAGLGLTIVSRFRRRQ
ncbi:MAG: PEP-CTERM sorting domain-containing protein [Planctomycetota bacterium]|jgi:streptogramin lyase